MVDPVGADACHCHATRRCARAVTRLYDRHLAPAGLSISQFSILSLLGQYPGIKCLDLADRMVMERTTLVRALKSLQDKGLVLARPAEGCRAFGLSLTDEGELAVADAKPLWEAAQADFEKTFGRDQSRRLRAANLDIALRA